MVVDVVGAVGVADPVTDEFIGAFVCGGTVGIGAGDVSLKPLLTGEVRTRLETEFADRSGGLPVDG